MTKGEKKSKELEKCRLRAGRWLGQGIAQAEVARRVGVSRATVCEWNARLAQGGGAGARVFDRALELAAHRPINRAALWLKVQRGPGLAHSRQPGLQLPTSGRAGPGTRRSGDPPMAAQALAGAKKNARAQGRIIVFVDESGLSERPHRVRTWAPRGQPPVLQYCFNWNQLSVIAGVTVYRFYFRLFPGAIKSPPVIAFLSALKAQLKRKLLVIWDGLPAHRSHLVRDYLESLHGAIQIERLPSYAPELNPTEYVWGYLKQHEWGNLCPHNFFELTEFARNRLQSMQRRPTLITAFWKQADLPL